ncbi:MAG TPA: hypothetical protein VKE88_03555 [Candidatus Nanoarchaeia archaeon]|nr:hypothetical protein [Candidatus Nanoarchaeia archaeon]
MKTPGKRGLDLFVFLVLITSAFAAHTATVTTNYVSIYETNPTNITITVDNDLFSTDSINTVDVQTTGFTISNIVQLLGWTITNNNSISFFTATNAISNWGLQRFGFSAVADVVTQDTTNTWTITTTDTQSGTQSQQLQLTVLNDNTPPVLGTVIPGAFISGTTTELFSIQATDAETAITGGQTQISTCDLVYDPLTNTSSVQYTPTTAACANGSCDTTEDLSAWTEGDVCYFFTVSNAGGETATSGNYVTIIDRTAPVVSSVNPPNAQFFAVTTVNLDFNAQDNYDTTLDCVVDVDGTTTAVVSSTVSNTFQYTGTDGTHTWTVSCTDDVALTGTTTAQTFSIDTQAPVITITAPSVVDRGTTATIPVSITDLGSGVDQNTIIATVTDPNNNVTAVTITNGQIDYPTTTATLPGTYIVDVSAADNLGQSASQSATFRVRETFAVTLASSTQQIDASTPNLTQYITITGTVTKDDATIPTGFVDLSWDSTASQLTLDALGAYNATLTVPQTNGIYDIIVTFTNGVDTFNATVTIAVGPYCGNGVIDNNEQCDGSAFTLQCVDYGFSQGSVSCTNTCTIDNSQCSNPPPAPSSGGGSGGSSRRSSSGSAGFIIPPPQLPAPVVEEEIVVEEPKTSGILEPIAIVEEPAPVQNQSTVGVGNAWASLTTLTQNINIKAVLALLGILGVLYVLGSGKKEDDWDRYFKRYGHK